jgi:hypothetical protein
MKRLLFFIFFFISVIGYSQNDSLYIKETSEAKSWSVSTTVGYINIPNPNLGNNVWGSVNLGYTKNNWNFTLWSGTNYWIDEKKPDLRLGISTTYTIFKW